jgi:hypothetical protein
MVRNRTSRWLLALAVLPLGACRATHSYTRSASIAAGPSLGREVRFYVALPVDGAFESTVYARSGAMTTEAVVAAFAPHAPTVAATATGSEAEAVASAQKADCTHVLYPTILHWEDRATEWSGKRDVLQVGLRMLSVPDQAVVDDVVIDGRSSWWSFGGAHPQHLLPKPLHDYAAALFAGGQ